MAYTKNTWVDQDVERPKTYEVTNNQDGSITLTDSFGLVQELGTPVNAVNMNHIEDGIANSADLDLSNLSSGGENHFLNKRQITNCILEAPNGVATYSGTIFTIKAGLKVLIPNGRNADGTLNNIEYTVENDITYDIDTGLNYGDYARILFISEEFSSMPINMIVSSNYYIGDTEPTFDTGYTGNRVWFDTKNNIVKYKKESASTWTNYNAVPIGIALMHSTNILSLYPYSCVQMANEKDLDGNFHNREFDVFNNVNITVKTPATALSYDVSSYLPDDNETYLLLCKLTCVKPANTAIGYHNLIVYSDIDFGTTVFENSIEQFTYDRYFSSMFPLIVGGDRKIFTHLYSASVTTAKFTLRVYGYRKVR